MQIKVGRRHETRKDDTREDRRKKGNVGRGGGVYISWWRGQRRVCIDVFCLLFHSSSPRVFGFSLSLSLSLFESHRGSDAVDDSKGRVV